MAGLVLGSNLQEKFSGVIRNNTNYIGMAKVGFAEPEKVDFEYDFDNILTGDVGIRKIRWVGAGDLSYADVANRIKYPPMLMFNYQRYETPREEPQYYFLYTVAQSGDQYGDNIGTLLKTPDRIDKSNYGNNAFYRFIRISRPSTNFSNADGVIHLRTLKINFVGVNDT